MLKQGDAGLCKTVVSHRFPHRHFATGAGGAARQGQYQNIRLERAEVRKWRPAPHGGVRERARKCMPRWARWKQRLQIVRYTKWHNGRALQHPPLSSFLQTPLANSHWWCQTVYCGPVGSLWMCGCSGAAAHPDTNGSFSTPAWCRGCFFWKLFPPLQEGAASEKGGDIKQVRATCWMTELGLHSKEKTWEPTLALTCCFLHKRFSGPLCHTWGRVLKSSSWRPEILKRPEYPQKSSDKSLPRQAAASPRQNRVSTHADPHLFWCRFIRAQINPGRLEVRGCVCDTGCRAFLTSTSPFILIENEAVGFQSLWGTNRWDGGVTAGLCKKCQKVRQQQD